MGKALDPLRERDSKSSPGPHKPPPQWCVRHFGLCHKFKHTALGVHSGCLWDHYGCLLDNCKYGFAMWKHFDMFSYGTVCLTCSVSAPPNVPIKYRQDS